MLTLLFIFPWFFAGPQGLAEIRGYDFANQNIKSIKLTKELSEASGLAFAANGNLLCHNDEQAVIFELDHRTGEVRKRFSLGKPLVYRGDLEGIATKGDTIFMVTSSGSILRALSGKDGEMVSFQTFKTPLTVRNDIEGLAYDPATDCLLLACKAEAGLEKNSLPKDQKAVYAFSLKTYKLLPEPRFLMPVSKIAERTGGKDSEGGKSGKSGKNAKNGKGGKGGKGGKDFNPSAIERHPRTGNFFVLASQGSVIVEMDANGNVLGASSLPKSLHPQPEGLTFTPDGTLLICNDGQGKDGSLVIYSPR